MTTARTISTLPLSGMRNRIINGNMAIDQRNAAGAFGTSINGYTLDRWSILQSVTGKLNGAQNWGSITPPAGFKNYLGVASQSSYSVSSTDYYLIYQPIEGFNVADFAFGSANAATVTLSFKVYSSLTGTFGGALKSSGGTRNYSFSYTISSANTWTSISVTIPGDTSGTWLTTDGMGIAVVFCLGSGSTRLGPANTWSSTNYDAPTGSVSLVGSGGATFYITGVQFEKGSVATPFEFRSYGQELALCQRYCQWIPFNMGFGAYAATEILYTPVTFLVAMRATPTMSGISAEPGVSQYAVNNGGNQFTPYSAYGAVAQLSAATAAQTIVLGYRSLATAEL